MNRHNNSRETPIGEIDTAQMAPKNITKAAAALNIVLRIILIALILIMDAAAPI